MTVLNREAFEKVCKELETGGCLTFRQIGSIFGPEFWEMLLLTLANVSIRTDGKIEVHIHQGEQ